MSGSGGVQVEGPHSAGGSGSGESVVRKAGFWTYTKKELSLGQSLWVIDLDELYKALETAHLRVLSGAVSKSGVPDRGAVRASEGSQLAVVGEQPEELQPGGHCSYTHTHRADEIPTRRDSRINLLSKRRTEDERLNARYPDANGYLRIHMDTYGKST
jgi:hypothetical protein